MCLCYAPQCSYAKYRRFRLQIAGCICVKIQLYISGLSIIRDSSDLPPLLFCDMCTCHNIKRGLKIEESRIRHSNEYMHYYTCWIVIRLFCILVLLEDIIYKVLNTVKDHLHRWYWLWVSRNELWKLPRDDRPSVSPNIKRSRISTEIILKKIYIPLLYVIQAQTPSRILKATNSQICLKGQLSSVVLQIGKNKTL